MPPRTPAEAKLAASMTPERWREVDAVVRNALAQPPEARATFVTDACHGDVSLQREVEELVAVRTGDFLERPAAVLFAAGGDAATYAGVSESLPATRHRLQAALGNAYRIDRELGGGGMSRVYVAEETAFQRKVVIKLLNAEIREEISVRRFEREIQFAARLQHPHVVPLLSAGTADGLLFYTMPFVEGESLRQRLRSEGRLPIDDVVRIIGDVASALGHAHRHGVVHRDIKPENILLCDGGAVVADFGIAKALSASMSDAATQTPQAALTHHGLAIGTPRYMAPEQASGDPAADHRVDLYALGGVAYEMLAGRPVFPGESAQQLMAAHAIEQPEAIGKLRPATPDWLASLVMHCLEKAASDRVHDAEEVMISLREAKHVVPRPAKDADAPKRSVVRWAYVSPALGAALIATLAAGAAIEKFAFSRSTGSSRDPESVSFQILPPTSGDTRERIGDLAISPDGKIVAFVARSDSSSHVYLRSLAEESALTLPGSSGAGQIAFSPDGRWLSIITFGGKLLRAAVDGSASYAIADTVFAWSGSTWENDRTILIGDAVTADRGVARVSIAGGKPLAVTRPKEWEHGRPFVAADGETLLFVDWGPGFTEDDFLSIGSLTTGRYTRTSLLAVQPFGVVDDKILYLDAAGNIMAAPFDAHRRRITGEPTRVIEGTGVTDWPDLPTVALSRTGTLVFKRGAFTQRFLLVDSSGNGHELMDDERDFGPMQGGGRPTFSPDGRRIAARVITHRADTTTAEIWTFDVRSRTFTRVTSIGNVGLPEWTRDGRALVFASVEHKRPSIWRQLADGTRPAEKLLELSDDGRAIFSLSTTPDGRGVVYCVGGAAGIEIDYLSILGGPPERLDGSSRLTLQCNARVSPDGRWLAYVFSDGEKPNVYARPFRAEGAAVQISSDGGDSPLWSRNGKQVFYRHLDAATASNYEVGAIGPSSILVADLARTDGALEVTRRRRVVKLREGGVFDVAPDAKHFLMLQRSDAQVRLEVITNWIPRLRAQLAGTR